MASTSGSEQENIAHLSSLSTHCTACVQHNCPNRRLPSRASAGAGRAGAPSGAAAGVGSGHARSPGHSPAPSPSAGWRTRRPRPSERRAASEKGPRAGGSPRPALRTPLQPIKARIETPENMGPPTAGKKGLRFGAGWRPTGQPRVRSSWVDSGSPASHCRPRRVQGDPRLRPNATQS